MKRKEIQLIKRREFLVSAATLAGAGLPAIGWSASAPCPPPVLSVTGGTTASSSCGASGGPLPVLTMTATSASGTLPWTFGQPFKKGAVRPGGLYAQSGATAFQADVRNTWPDGSVKFAVLSGVSTFSGSPVQVVLGTAGVLTSGSNVAEPTAFDASVAFSSPGTTVSLATARANGSMSWSKATAHKVRQILGPVMSEFHYYSPVSGDNHLAVWWYVRAYASGAVEVETVVENGWLFVASPGTKSYTATVIVGGAQKYSGSVTQYHHTRWSRTDWVGNDSSIIPAHDGAYLRATRLVPNFGYTGPTTAAWSANGAADTWGAPINNVNPAPLAQANFPASMGDYGYHESIGLMPRLDALYITSQNAVAYRSVIGNARSWGRYSVHYRDESTGRPFKVSAPNGTAAYATTLGFADNGTTKYGTERGTASLPLPSGSHNTITPTHAPAPAYLAYLITGRWQFMEHCQFNANFNWLCVPSTRRGASGVFTPGGGAMTTRGAAWSWRTLGMAACVTPDAGTGLDSGLKAEFVGMCTGNATYYKDLYVGGAYDNGISGVEQYGPAADVRPWMQDFLVAVVGFVSDLEVMSSANQAIHDQFRDWQYHWIVGRFGTTTATFCWQDAAQYSLLLEQSSQPHTPSNYFSTWGALYQYNNLGSTCSTSGDAHTSYGSKDMVTSYWANLTPGLAYAVDHAASGATAAYSRLTSCASYQKESLPTGTYGGFHNIPMWGVVPR